MLVCYHDKIRHRGCAGGCGGTKKGSTTPKKTGNNNSSGYKVPATKPKAKKYGW